jgi:transposase
MNKFTGIDISKQTFDCSIAMANGQILVKKLNNSLRGFTKLKSLLPEQAHVVMEASGPYYLKLAFYLFENHIPISIVNPLIIRRFCQMRMVRAKTDKKDAELIRQFGEAENPALWTPDEPSITKLKQLNSAIELMEKSITASNNQLAAFREMPDTDPALLKELKKTLKCISKQKEKLETEMCQVALTKYGSTYKALQSIPGIGPKSAAALIAITGNFKKFSNHKQLLAYVGLNPRIYESGTSVKGRGHISKMGTGRLRKILYMCSWSAKRHNSYCLDLYTRLKAKAKPERVIKVAIANKLLRQAFAIGTTGINFKNNLPKNL